MKTILFLIIILSTIQSLHSKILWEGTYGREYLDIASEIIVIDDNNILVAGYSNIPNLKTSTDNYDMYILKIDSLGNIIWDQTFGGKGEEKINSMALMRDSSIILTGRSRSKEVGFESPGGWALWLVKVSSEGRIMWHKTMGSKYIEEGNDVIVTDNNEIVVVGFSSSTSNDISQNYGESDYWVIKLDSTGKVLWEKNYGGSKGERAKSIIQTVDGCFIVIGQSLSADGDITQNVKGDDLWIIKIDRNGDLLWDKSYGKEISEYAVDIEEWNDYLIIAARVETSKREPKTNQKNDNIWLLKLDNNGEMIWEKEFGALGNDLCSKILLDSAENILIGGSTQSVDSLGENNRGGMDFLFMKVDKNGNLIYSKTYGGNMNDVSYSFSLNSRGEIYLAGYSQSLIGQKTKIIGGADYWIIKIDLEEE